MTMPETNAPEKQRRKKTRIRTKVLRTSAALVVLYAVWLLLAYTQQERILFPGATAWNALTRPAPVTGPEWERWDITREDGAGGLAWFRGAPESDEPVPAAVFFHGNADIARNRLDIGNVYHAMGMHTLLIEYPGYDGSQGTPGQESLVEDALLALKQLTARHDVDADRLIFHGHSIGGGAAAQLTAVRTPATLILESTFTSLNDMVRRYAVPSAVLRHTFETDAVLPRLTIPVLIMHGDLDVIIYPSHAEHNASITRDVEFVRFADYGHDGCYVAPNYADTIRAFLVNRGIIAE